MTRRELVAVLVLGSCAAAQSPVRRVHDPRYARLLNFFRSRRCPAAEYTDFFLEEADNHKLDWRLLPSLAFVETGGGRRVRCENNWFGWNSGQARFRMVEDAIHTVAVQLSESGLYRGKSLAAVLRTYNHRPSYPSRIRKVMALIGPKVLENKHENGNK